MGHWHRGSWLGVVGLLMATACSRGGGGGGGLLEAPQRLNAEPGTLARFTFPYYTAIDAAADGSAVVVWMRLEPPNRPLVYQRAPSATAAFGEARYLGSERFTPTISVVPSLLHGPGEGELYAVWQSRQPTSGDKSVVFRRSADAGETWQEEAVVNSGRTAFIPAMAGDSDGAVYVAWTDERRFRNAVHFNRSLDHGATWMEQDVAVGGDKREGSAVSVGIASDGHGRVVIVWENAGGEGRQIDVAVSTDRGTTWEGPIRIDDARRAGGMRYSPTAPRVVFAGDRAVVVWTAAATNVVGQVWSDSSSDGGRTWGTDVVLQETEKGVPPVAHLVSAGTTAHVVFHGGALAGDWQIYHRRTGADGGWEHLDRPAVQVSRGPGRFANPRIAVDRDGALVVVYSDDNRRILLSHSPDGGATWDDAREAYAVAPEQGKATARFPQVAIGNGVAYVLWEAWADPTGMFKGPADSEHKVIPADLFVRRANFRR